MDIVVYILMAVALHIVLASWATGHIVLNKETPQSAVGWIGWVWTWPLLGCLFYRVFGINRVQAKAMKLLNSRSPDGGHESNGTLPDKQLPDIEAELELLKERDYAKLIPLAKAGTALTGLPLTRSNKVEALSNGDETYPAMLDAIADAENYVLIQSYIFSFDTIGKKFTEALVAAEERGVTVRVLVDGMGEIGSLPPTSWKMRKRGLTVGRFIPIRWFVPPLRINLRNHRKLMVVDGQVGFTGGVNIIDDHWSRAGELKTQDLHYRLTGPIALQLQQVFAADWKFSTEEDLDVELASEAPTDAGASLCRAVTDVPIKNSPRLKRLYVAAINSAQERVSIITPYFLPLPEISSALVAASLRGVRVDIIVPSAIDHKIVEWASQRFLDELLPVGIHIWQQPPPFAHTKLLVIDTGYAMVGSCNLDPRSLSLNFEMNVEIFDGGACDPLLQKFDRIRDKSTPMKSSDSQGLAGRLRCGFSWLFSPYL